MFEFLLARRYIKTQKRHSALTICSIVVAVTLMSMLFTGFATLRGCMRAAHYDFMPYHMRFSGMTSAQMDEIEKLPELKSYDKSKLEDGTYQIDVMFKKNSMKDVGEFLQTLSVDKLGISYEDFPYWRLDHIEANTSLMNDDLVDDNARAEFVQLLCLFYVFIVIIALALRLIIDTAFEISSRERERQFGVLQSVGATPKQIVRIMTAEGLILSGVGIPIGLACGILCAYIAFKRILQSGIADAFFSSDKAEQIVRFHISPLMLLIAAVTSLAWVLFSAYGTGLRVVKKSPVEAISARSNNVRKVRRRTLMGLIFGWVGKLTSRNARRHPKRYIVTILSLTLSLGLFAGVGSVMYIVTDIMDKPVDRDICIDYDYSVFDLLGYKKGIEELEKSGYFSRYYVSVMNGARDVDTEKAYYIHYMSEPQYNNMMCNKAPISYDELKKSGGFLYVSTMTEPDKSIKSLELEVTELNASDEMRKTYEEAFKEYQASRVNTPDDNDAEEIDDDPENKYKLYSKVVKASKDNIKKTKHTFDIAASCKQPKRDNDASPFAAIWDYGDDENESLYLIAPIEKYEAGDYKLYGNFHFNVDISCDIKSPDVHDKAVRYIDDNKDMKVWLDVFEMMQQLRTTMAAFAIAGRFITGLIALIAIVNMINIVSTGIVNRRSEIASMQCVGMTQGQLYKMAIVEGLQYTIFATIGAILLSVAGMFLTEQFLILTEAISHDDMGKYIRYSEPVWRVLAASGAAFLVSIIAAVIPLKIMQKTSLIDQIRSVD